MEKSLGKNFILYVSRNVVGMIALSCYILADTFFIAQALGPQGLTALNLSISIFSFMLAFGLMLGIGGASRYAICQGQGKYQEADGVFSSVVWFSLFFSLGISLVGMFFSGNLAHILGANNLALPMTRTYLWTILIAAPLFILNNVFVAFVRNDNKPSLSMLAMLIGSLSNIILDYIFLFPLKMGMFGAAFATTLSPLISLMVLCRHFLKGGKSLSFLKRGVRFSHIKDAMVLGFSAFVTEISSGIVLLSFNYTLLRFGGNMAVAAYSIVANLALVALSFFTGLGQGIQPLISRYYGRGQIRSIKKLLKWAFSSALLMSIIIYSISYIFKQEIVMLFNSQNILEIAKLAEEGIKIYFLAFFFAGPNICLCHYLSASEKSRPAFLLSIGRGFIIILPSLYICTQLWGIKGAWMSFVISEFIVWLVGIYLLKDLDTRDKLGN